MVIEDSPLYYFLPPRRRMSGQPVCSMHVWDLSVPVWEEMTFLLGTMIDCSKPLSSSPSHHWRYNVINVELTYDPTDILSPSLYNTRSELHRHNHGLVLDWEADMPPSWHSLEATEHKLYTLAYRVGFSPGWTERSDLSHGRLFQSSPINFH